MPLTKNRTMYRLLALLLLLLPLRFAGAAAPGELNTRSAIACHAVDHMERLLALSDALTLLKQLEGYRSSAYWDVNAYRCGYGTPCRSNETTTEQRAGEAAKTALVARMAFLRTRYPHLRERQIAALAVMRYNVGSFGPDLDAAIRSGDDERIAEQMLRYTKSAGISLPALRVRRLAEIQLLTK